MDPKEYFPRPDGKEKFLPPFTNAVKPEKSKKVPRVCAQCKKVMGEVEAIGSDKSEGLCPECGKGYYWESEKPPEPGEKK